MLRAGLRGVCNHLVLRNAQTSRGSHSSHISQSSVVLCRQVACRHSSSVGILDERFSLGSSFEAARMRSKTTLGNPPKSSISHSFADEVNTHL